MTFNTFNSVERLVRKTIKEVESLSEDVLKHWYAVLDRVKEARR